eukprot:scaffold52416_cov33-Tisochrysis_lutea.AAC.3
MVRTGRDAHDADGSHRGDRRGCWQAGKRRAELAMAKKPRPTHRALDPAAEQPAFMRDEDRVRSRSGEWLAAARAAAFELKQTADGVPLVALVFTLLILPHQLRSHARSSPESGEDERREHAAGGGQPGEVRRAEGREKADGEIERQLEQ